MRHQHAAARTRWVQLPLLLLLLGLQLGDAEVELLLPKLQELFILLQLPPGAPNIGDLCGLEALER